MGAQWKQKWRELAADKKGKMVGKLVREIQVAAKLGGPNPEFNARLQTALENARRQSVTRDTIERAIAKGSGTGADAVHYETVVFEGFAPHRVPVIVEALTDNNNRTSSEVRVIFRAGSLGQRGGVSWMFDFVGMIEATHADAAIDRETEALEAEAEDVEVMEWDDMEDAGGVGTAARFFTAADQLDRVSKALRQRGWVVRAAELHYRPKEYPELSEDARAEVTAFLHELDDHPDVNRIYVALR